MAYCREDCMMPTLFSVPQVKGLQCIVDVQKIPYIF